MARRMVNNITVDELDRLERWFRTKCDLRCGARLVFNPAVTLYRSQQDYFVKGREHELSEIFGVNRVYKDSL